MKKLKIFNVAILTSLMLSGVTVAQTQNWPQEKPITIIVPFPPGGLTDVLARRMAKDLQEELKQKVVVENRAGASGQIGTQVVANANPDGYTLLVSATHHVINPAIKKSLPYDPYTSFTNIALLGTTPNLLVVNPNKLKVKNFQDFSKYVAKEKNGIAFASTSIGGSTHLSGELLKQMTGLPLLHVPYKGTSPALTDLLGGQISLAFLDISAVLQHIQSGKLQALGLTSKNRVAAVPDIPTFHEQGVKDYEATTWIGFYGPKGLPIMVVESLNKIAINSMSNETNRPWLDSSGVIAGNLNSNEFHQFVNNELIKWKKVVDDANIEKE